MKVKTVVKLVVGLVIVGGIGFGCYYGYNMKMNYEQQLADKTNQINELQTKINYVGELKTAYVLDCDAKGGTEIKESDLKEVQIPSSIASQCVIDKDSIKNKYYLIDIEAGKLLTTNLVEDMKIDDDSRYLDIVCDETPMGIEVGDYVDVRISFTLGQDFIALTHKRVAAMSDNALKIVVNQKDIQVYQSMIVDKAIYSGTKIYAIQYVEGGVQNKAKNYYPIRIEDLTTLIQDPNVKSSLKDLSLVDRDQLERTLNQSNEALKQVLSVVASAKSQLSSQYNSSKAAYEAALEKAAQAKLEGGDGTTSESGGTEISDDAVRIN